MKKLSIAFIAAFTIMVSCKKDDDKKTPDSPSRTIQYEITGNFSGTVIASYTTAGGGTANDQVTLPWNKEVAYEKGVAAAIIAVTGSGGAAGQKVTVFIKRGGSQVGTPMEAVAGTSGGFSKAAPVVVF